MAQIGSEHGLYDRIGPRHLGLFIEEGETLVVAFDRAERAWAETRDGLPAGFEMVRRRSWSLLSVMSIGETWFKDAALLRFFRTLERSGLLSRYRRVVFFGIGPDCGFAACTFSQMVPGARVLAAAPVATLNPSEVPFERRFRGARRLDFTGPMGHAPRSLRKARDAVILHDPTDVAMAAQAALFAAPNTTLLGMPYAGRDFARILLDEGASVSLLRMLSEGERDATELRAALKGPSRACVGTQLRKARAALVQGHAKRAGLIARHGFEATGDRRFSALLTETQAALLPKAGRTREKA